MIDNITNKIGIGTVAPNYQLTIKTGTGSNYGMVQTNGTIEVGSKVDGTAGWFGTPTNHPLYLFANATSIPQLTIDNATNNIGIGTVTPTKKLDIKGSINKNDIAAENLFQITTADPSNNLNLQLGLIGNSNSNNRYGLIEVKEGSGYKSLVLQPTNGNVAIGLGSDAPATKLEVNGTLKATGIAYFNSGVAIGTSLTCGLPSGYKLAVKGKVICEEVEVKLENNNCWADYVFDSTYNLMSLKEVEQFVIKNKHLPNIPSSSQLVEKGMNVNEMLKLQMEKIEELTLYMIQIKKENDELRKLIKN
jgi:hypothetical protein